MSKPENIPTLEENKTTLAGSLMQFMIDEIRQMPDVWVKLSEEKQNEIIDRVEKQARSNVARAVDIVLSDGRPSVSARIDKIEFKKGIKIVLDAYLDEEYKHALVDHGRRGEVMVVLVNKDQYTGGPKTVEADPDQRNMDFQHMEDDDPGDKMGEVEDDELREFEGNEITGQKLDDLMEEEPEAFSAQ